MRLQAIKFSFLLLLGELHAQVITSDTYFYGDSPPVYPSREFS